MPPIAFAHIDCDQYQSVKDTLLYLMPLMAPGGVMWFDDYGEIEEAKRAVDECCVGRLEPRIGARQIVRFA
jgi:asparagine synthase (glutamine-hydrolysing)